MASILPTSSILVEQWFNGLYAALLLVTLWIVATHKDYIIRKKIQLISLLIVMYTGATIHSAISWDLFAAAAVDANEASGDGGLLQALKKIQPWQVATASGFYSLNILLADALFIWRCWVVWGRNWWVTIIPTLGTLAGIALAIISIHIQVQASQNRDPLLLVKQASDFVHFSTAYFSISIATSLITTLLITLRIFLVEISVVKAGMRSSASGRNAYRAVIEIIVEAAVLYSITLLIMVCFISTKNGNLPYAQNIHAQVAGMAPLLIILRVAAGHSRPDSEWSSNVLQAVSTLRFGAPDSVDHTTSLSLEEVNIGIETRTVAASNTSGTTLGKKEIV
ncbi:hypothetical protein K435DRAFT_970155 [Dendrothele bispora CBS 962.96]|uniref:Uncharacterized protein n=1 Tax=Dendrothele bispora (strain CBS 962.96) TaxID=1314807 RepID=A0A4S8LD33_DENBC|nr:hypothetical protein K435DRAFT_970155 [Dendrothele bispora CBS 962.96]